MRVAYVNVIQSGPVNVVSGLTSQGYYVGHVTNYALQAVFTGAPVGILKIQISCDIGNPNASGPYMDDNIVNWIDLPGASSSISGAGQVLLSLVDAGYSWVRVVYTPTSGTGNISVCQLNLKGF
jgi:hypothetical protein